MISKFLLAEIIITAILVGLIWTIQVLNYPLFNFVNESDFHNYHHFHMSSITMLVGPLMIFELLLRIINMYNHQQTIFVGILLVICLLIIWGTTLFVSVPLHNQLAVLKDTALINKLIFSNWLRTIFWTIKLSLLIFFIKN